MKIRTNDEVVVIAGKDRGKRGRVVRVLKEENKVVVEGVNLVTRHLRRNPQNPQSGGRVQRAAPIHASNVMVWSHDDGKGVRIAYRGKGRDKVRVVAGSGRKLPAPGRAASKGGARKRRKEDEESGE